MNLPDILAPHQTALEEILLSAVPRLPERGQASRAHFVVEDPYRPRSAGLERAPVDVAGARPYGFAMARLSLVDSSSDDADPLARSVLQAVSAARGRSVDPNVYRAVANHPQALQALVQFGTVVYFQNSMTPAQRELAYLTASVTNECHY